MISPASADLHRLSEQMVELWTRYDARCTYETIPFVPSQAAIGSTQRSLQEIQTRLTTLQPATLLEQLTQQHLQRLGDCLEYRLADDRRMPFRYLWTVNSSRFQLEQMDSRPQDVRDSLRNDLLRNSLPLLQWCQDHAENWDSFNRDAALQQLKRLRDDMMRYAPGDCCDPDAPPGSQTGSKLQRLY